ncbi:hypothetical protein LTR17_011398 [Elasticomyces elasticus]|nr:hypothetical protein LTR17_011398 [Elasticomyces elasticus]
MEEKEKIATSKALDLVSTFSNSFLRMSYTVHPSGLPGEAQGKSSNESWAAKQACHDHPAVAQKRDTVITVMDADTHLSSRYFAQISKSRRVHSDRSPTTIYMPPIVFDRNLHRTPLLVRIADVMWASAGISSMYYGSNVCIPTSVYSLPMTLVEHVQGWDCDPGAIGEDLHMFLKCFLALSGNLRMQVIYAAASQCNVSSQYSGLRGYAGGLLARYQQAVRHMWGALDTGYAIRQAFLMLSRSRRRARSCEDRDNSLSARKVHAWLQQTFGEPSTAPSDFIADTINWYNITLMFFRLYEAHFMPLHLSLILTTSTCYSLLYPRFLMPGIMRLALDISAWCRFLGFCSMLFGYSQYEHYHRRCVGLRQEEMRKAGLLERMVEQNSFSPNVFMYVGILEAAVFAIGGFLYGAIPALQAEFSHVFTTRLTYVVSLKP